MLDPLSYKHAADQDYNRLLAYAETDKVQMMSMTRHLGPGVELPAGGTTTQQQRKSEGRCVHTFPSTRTGGESLGRHRASRRRGGRQTTTRRRMQHRSR
jgi:hypothetical protein